jgi:hypothetical protein
MSMTKEDMEPYYDLLHMIIKRAQSDAIKDPRERPWVHSQDARELCEMADIQYPEFKDAVLNKIQAHDAKKQESSQ